MPICSKKTLLKKILPLLFAGVAIIMCVVLFMFIKHLGPFAQKKPSSDLSIINYNPPTKQEQSTGDAIKQDTTSKNNGADTTQTPTPIPGSAKSSIDMSITSISQSSDTLSIRSIIAVISSDGKCTLTMSGPNDKTYTSSVDIQPGPSSSTCKGFNVPLDALSSGKWSIKITYDSDKLTASTSSEATVQ